MKSDYFLLVIDDKNLRSAKHREFRQLIPLAKPNDIVFITTVGEGGGIISPGIPFSDLAQQEIRWPDSLGEPDNKDIDYISELYFQFSAIAESAQLHWIILVDVDKFSQLIEDVRSSFNVKWSSVSAHLEEKKHTLLKSQHESSEEIKRKLPIINSMSSNTFQPEPVEDVQPEPVEDVQHKPHRPHRVVKHVALDTQAKTTKVRSTNINGVGVIGTTFASILSVIFASIVSLPVFYNINSNLPSNMEEFSIAQITTMLVGFALGATVLWLCYQDLLAFNKREKKYGWPIRSGYSPIGPGWSSSNLIFLSISVEHYSALASCVILIFLAWLFELLWDVLWDARKGGYILNSAWLRIPYAIYFISVLVIYFYSKEICIFLTILGAILGMITLIPSRFYKVIIPLYMVITMVWINTSLGYLTTVWQTHRETVAFECDNYSVGVESKILCINDLTSGKWQSQDIQIQQTGSSLGSRTTYANYNFTYNECINANLEVYQDFNPKDAIFGNTRHFQDRIITLQPVMEHPSLGFERVARYTPGRNSWQLLEWFERSNDKYSRVRDYQLISEGQDLGLQSTQAVLHVDENNCDFTSIGELDKAPQDLMKHINLASSQYIDSTFTAINNASEVEKPDKDDLQVLAGPNVNRAVLPQNDQEGLLPENWGSGTMLLIKGIDENDEIPVSIWLRNRPDLDSSKFDGRWTYNAWEGQSNNPLTFSFFFVNQNSHSRWEYGISISDPTAIVGETTSPTELMKKLQKKLSYLFDSSYLFHKSMKDLLST
jgi:hypothetical protein